MPNHCRRGCALAAAEPFLFIGTVAVCSDPMKEFCVPGGKVMVRRSEWTNQARKRD